MIDLIPRLWSLRSLNPNEFIVSVDGRIIVTWVLPGNTIILTIFKAANSGCVFSPPRRCSNYGYYDPLTVLFTIQFGSTFRGGYLVTKRNLAGQDIFDEIMNYCRTVSSNPFDWRRWTVKAQRMVLIDAVDQIDELRNRSGTILGPSVYDGTSFGSILRGEYPYTRSIPKIDDPSCYELTTSLWLGEYGCYLNDCSTVPDDALIGVGTSTCDYPIMTYVIGDSSFVQYGSPSDFSQIEFESNVNTALPHYGEYDFYRTDGSFPTFTVIYVDDYSEETVISQVTINYTTNPCPLEPLDEEPPFPWNDDGNQYLFQQWVQDRDYLYPETLWSQTVMYGNTVQVIPEYYECATLYRVGTNNGMSALYYGTNYYAYNPVGGCVPTVFNRVKVFINGVYHSTLSDDRGATGDHAPPPPPPPPNCDGCSYQMNVTLKAFSALGVKQKISLSTIVCVDCPTNPVQQFIQDVVKAYKISVFGTSISYDFIGPCIKSLGGYGTPCE